MVYRILGSDGPLTLSSMELSGGVAFPKPCGESKETAQHLPCGASLALVRETAWCRKLLGGGQQQVSAGLGGMGVVARKWVGECTRDLSLLTAVIHIPC